MPKFITIGDTRYNTDEIVKYRPLGNNETGIVIRNSNVEIVYHGPVEELDKLLSEDNTRTSDSLIRQFIRSMDNLAGHIQQMPTSFRVHM